MRLWSHLDGVCKAVFHGHKSAVSALAFSADGATLVSGGRDTEIIIWDIISETGLFKLRGHRDMITGCKLLSTARKLISSSKDGLVKVWDMDSRHCVQTLVGHRNPVWGFDVNAEETRMVTGSIDSKLRVWKLGEDLPEVKKEEKGEEEIGEDDAEKDQSEENFAVFYGTLDRAPVGGEKDRVMQVSYNKEGTLLGCQGTKYVEFFNILDEGEVKARLKRRLKRKQKKNEAKGEAEEGKDQSALQEPKDEMVSLGVLRRDSKLTSFAFGAINTRRVLLALRDNSMEVHEISLKGETDPFKQIAVIDHSGHRGDIRFVAVSSDNTQILTISDSGAKVWNSRTGQCTRTLEISNGLCGLFAPGDLHIIIGTRDGKLEVVELASGDHIPIAAHTGSVWSISLHPDGASLVSASADHQVKFWNFSLDDTRTFTLVPTRSLEMETDALFVRFSPNGQLLAVALMDNTVKVWVFFVCCLLMPH